MAGPELTVPRRWWIAACGLVLVAVVIAAALGSATPTARATPQTSGPVGSTSPPVLTAPPAGVTGAPPSPLSAPSSTVPPPVTAAPSTPTPTDTTSTTTAAPAVPPNGVSVRVTGTGQASLTLVDGAAESQVSDVTLPWVTTLTDSPASVNVSAQSSEGSDLATISCAIDAPGTSPVTNVSSGPFAVVSCGATLGR